MVSTICILALSLSLDALGVGIAYGLRKIKIPVLSAVFICMFSILYSGASVYFGKYISSIIPPGISKLIGIFILLLMGCWIIIHGLIENKSMDISKSDVDIKANKYIKNNLNILDIKDETLIKVAIKSLGITIQVIRNPSECDIDKSGTIDVKESILLGLALSLDAIGVGIGSALSGYYSAFLPLAVGLFQLVLLFVGTFLGKRITAMEKFNQKIITIVPGILLIILAIIRIY
ncbi:MAG TPA: sporulation membrane protein YtaF [Clostridiales bacterium]|nr:sporulation membrane protein YtaF [Clostridiales bacterium]